MNYLKIISDNFAGTSGITNECWVKVESVGLFNIFIIFHKNAFLSDTETNGKEGRGKKM